ncbi:MAG: GNAT family N-acetyltransferase [Acidobacteriota bacterium]
MSRDSPHQKTELEVVTMDCFDEAVDVLCEAFFDYPVMRYLVGDADGDYERRLRLLVEFFSRARHLRGDLVWAVRSKARISGVANIVCPHTEAPPELEEARQSLWAELGEAVQRKYEEFGEATAQFSIPEPHFHLSMIGVRRANLGQGIGRRLLEGLHTLSAADSTSLGVSLTTEDPANVALYEHFGYEIVGRTEVGDFTSWSFFRRD